MRLSVHTVICCCVFTTVLPLVVTSAKEEPNASLKKSFSPNIRSRRSPPSKSSGCFLVTCVYQDLFHILYQTYSSQGKQANAPKAKIGSTGYGRRRRRRSLLDVTRLAILKGRQRRSQRHKSTNTVA